MSGLHIVPVSFAVAAGFVGEHHRHHRPPVGHKFSIGVACGDVLVGVAIVGRPVARHYDDGLTLEVNRTATDGTANANSVLYGAAWRAAKALGYSRLITYTQAGESGGSLRGAGWRVVAERPGRRGWSTPSRPRNDRGVDLMPRTLWEATPMPADQRRCPVTIPATATTVAWRCIGWLDGQDECSHRRYHPEDTPDVDT